MSRDNIKCGFQVAAILKSNMADTKRQFQVAQYLKMFATYYCAFVPNLMLVSQNAQQVCYTATLFSSVYHQSFALQFLGSGISTYYALLCIVQITRQEKPQIRQTWPTYRDTDSAPQRLAQYTTTFSLAAPMDPHPTRFLRPIRAHNPNGTPIGSAVFAQTTVDYTLQWDAHSYQNICPFPWGDLDPN